MITMATGTTLRLLGGANLAGGRNITIPKDGNVFLDVPSGTATWAGYTTNNPNELGTQTTITKTGAGLLNWTSGVPANPNYDQLIITGGTLQIANTNPLPTGAVTVEGGALQLNTGAI
jgi:autotransporter-associated beta strand protein